MPSRVATSHELNAPFASGLRLPAVSRHVSRDICGDAEQCSILIPAAIAPEQFDDY